MKSQGNDRTDGRDERKLLVIDDEANMRHVLATLLAQSGYRVETAADGRQGLEKLGRTGFDFVLCDIKMPRMDGMAFLKAAAGFLNRTTVIMMSAYGNIDTAVEAMKLGAYDYISKPFKPDEVNLVLRKAEERERLKTENISLKQRLQHIEADAGFGNMIAKSEAMRAVFRLAGKAARYDTTVLITGESGTGKELVARGLHQAGSRARMPLVPVNCGGIPENLLESELFGYRRGAFTGAERDRKGLFREAAGGTVFLDEIGELPVQLQVKILRVLQENEIRPLGDSASVSVDVRVIAATSKNLEAEVRAGNFREDLYFRLNVLPIRLPPLRERTEDIPLLSEHFLERFNRSLDKNIRRIAPETMKILLEHRWPGNVRELENAIERGVVLSEGQVLLPEHLPPEITAPAAPAAPGTPSADLSLKKARRRLEKELITRALFETEGNRTRAAKLLEISHPNLLSKIKTYGIEI